MGNHGTKQTEDSDIDRSPDYVAFMKDLASYHQQRGTHLQREPALGPRRISLLKLYNKIIAYGGYDKVSDTSLMWRRIADEYHVPPMSNAGMPGYLLKSMYYKNLAAFEIERHWGKKAPPPELLEQLTARGGAILSRPEIANPPPPKLVSTPVSQIKNVRATPIPKMVQQQQQSQQYHYAQHIPAQIMMPHMPPVTQTTTYHRVPPQSEYVRALYPITAGQFGSSTLHDASTNHLLPLVPRTFIDQHKPEEREGDRTSLGSLYRAAMTLKSGLAAESTWAAETLIKASYELGDDLILEKVSGLAEVLLSMIDEGASALTQAHTTEALPMEDILVDGSTERSAKRMKLRHGFFRSASLPPSSKVLEAALILRNLTFQPENARFIARLPITTRILRTGLLLSGDGVATELKQYCIDLCDAVLPALQISSEEDPFYLTLVEFLKSQDRAQLLLALRGLSRLSVADEHNRLLQDINSAVIGKLIGFLQLEDVELLHALVGFFFQFTTYQANTSILVRNGELLTLLQRLVGLTMWNAQDRIEHLQITNSQIVTREPSPPPANPPQLSDEIVRELLTFQEPERAIHWMRACFEDDKEESVTQILLWQSYRTLFTPYSQPQHNGSVVVSGKPLLQAADVIKMVGNAFHGATAMVVNHPTEGQKFIVRGVRCRQFPLAPSGKRYATCRWITNRETEDVCAAPFANQKELHAHIMAKHVKTTEGPITCAWASCKKFSPKGETDHKKISIHLRLHTSNMFPVLPASRTIQGTKIDISSQATQQDDKGEPRGLALSATLTLRNILCAEARVPDSQDLSFEQLREDLLSHVTVNPVVAHQAGEVLTAL